MMVMVVLLHVLCALVSLVYSSFVYISPSYSRLRISYGLVTLTIISGTYLVISTHSNMLQACLAGLIYLAVVLAGLLSARRKLAIQQNKITD
jgi:hypothetical protein